jgi:drug/metabolite transporter (DMT)-like permease
VLGLLALGGEKFTHRNTMRIALGLAGVYLLIGPGGNASLTGVLLVILANVAFAVHLVMMQWYLKDYHAQTVTMVIAGTIAVCTAAIWLSQNNSFAWPGWPALLLIGVLAVGSTFLGQLAQFAALRLLGSGQMAMLNPPETLLTVIWSILLLHENLTPLQWAGSGLILVSMLLARQRLLRVRVIPWRSGLRLRW